MAKSGLTLLGIPGNTPKVFAVAVQVILEEQYVKLA